MGTPAIDRNVTTTHPSSIVSMIGGGTSPGPLVADAWDTEKRPASSTIPIDPETGWRACAPWTHSGRLFTCNSGTVIRKTVVPDGSLWSGSEWRDGSFWSTYSPPSLAATPFGLQSEAEVKALNRLKDVDIHLGNFLAEAKRTILMVGGTSYRIADQVLDFRKKHPNLWVAVKRWEAGGLPRRLWNCIPNIWLELQYGWRPLLSDIFGALQHLEKASRSEDLLFKVKGQATRYESIQRKLNAISGTSTVDLESFQKHIARVVLWYKLRSPVLAELSSLGLLNPLEIVWEIRRFSFVLDWILPIGNWLSSLTGDAGYDFKSGSCSVKSTADDRVMAASWEDQYEFGYYHTTASGSLPNISGLAYRFERTCYESSPVPGVYFKNPLSTEHMLNGLALLAQAFR